MNSISYGLAFGYLLRSVSTDSAFGIGVAGLPRFATLCKSTGSILIVVPPVTGSIRGEGGEMGTFLHKIRPTT